ncbi:3-keto-5-aminohexanoate cleavage protein [Umezawaea sp. Da 62-37]|uniref:3-keto-5-aminohexanoate cleavage protein n=1 Tax=Umezawaea sp. Da 62-37 TaxID=3075927 RepID=UPI0028F6FB29|nr:3-keto-5-aminohexanoate cleavage protein [Umezawaea sp. Da 62-37]WNV91159.1 3-keto-5-aminohexanoate cleavage protein [Umezawaea sp. Da 62-37]
MARPGSRGTLLTVAPRATGSVDGLVAAVQSSERVGAAVVRVRVVDVGKAREVVAALRERTSVIVRLAADADRPKLLDAVPDSLVCPVDEPWESLVDLHDDLRERGIVPEYEVTGAAQFDVLRRLLGEHGPPSGGRVHVGLVLGTPGGLPGDAETLIESLRSLPEGASFSAAGVGVATIPVMLAALAVGGHLRVGMSDTESYAEGQPVRDDVQLVARAAGLAKIAQRPPLPVVEARELLGVHGPVRV